jgi:anti-sigma regulatory factor (Ser/Thr protein kinase)
MAAMLHLALPAHAHQVASARAAIGEVCDRLGLEGGLSDDIRLAVSEAATGCVLHSASGSEPAATFVVDAAVEGDSLEVVVRDFVAGLVRGPIRGGGRGLGMQLVRHLADWSDLSSSPSRGMRVEMHFALPAATMAAPPVPAGRTSLRPSASCAAEPPDPRRLGDDSAVHSGVGR